MKASDDELLTTDQAAQMLALTVGALTMRRRLGLAPGYLKMGHAVRYKRRDLLAYLAQAEVRLGRPNKTRLKSKRKILSCTKP